MSAPTAKASGHCPYCGAPHPATTRFCTQCGSTFAPPAAPAGKPRRGIARMLPTTGAAKSGSDLFYVIVAAVLVILLSDLPVIKIVTYPFMLFETFVHEWSHAVVAVLTGGQVVSLQINPGDLSGLTGTTGGWLLPIYSAGYIGAAVAGALLLLTPSRYAKYTLVGMGAAAALMPLAAVAAFGTTFSGETWAWSFIFSAVALLVGLRAEPRIVKLFQQFIAVELCLKAIDDLRTVGWLSLNSPNTFTDAIGASHASILPAIFWAVLWGIIGVAAIGFSAFRVVRRSVVA